jgi:Mrp family chromosome partitioning ATPase
VVIRYIIAFSRTYDKWLSGIKTLKIKETSVLIVFASGKGGVGKTTSAIAFAAAFSERSPVLLDLDSGADASWSLGFDFGDAAVELMEGKRGLQGATNRDG